MLMWKKSLDDGMVYQPNPTTALNKLTLCEAFKVHFLNTIREVLIQLFGHFSEGS